MEEFSFARTPVLGHRADTTTNVRDEQRWFNKWVETTECIGLPSPQLLGKAQAQTAKLCAENLGVVEQSDRYEGHTADLLFTRWLENTEAVLAGAQSPGPTIASGAATPATLSRYMATPSQDILSITGHPLSVMRQAVDRACMDKKESALGGGWYEASPLAGAGAARAAFALWRDTDASDDQGSRGGHSRVSSEGGHEEEGGDRQGLDDATMRPLMQDMEMSTLGADMGGDMQISPMPTAVGRNHRSHVQGPPDPTEQVLELMVSPVLASKVASRWAPREGMSTPGPAQAGNTSAGVEEEEEGGQDMSVWGSENRESESDNESDSAGNVDLAGMGFTPYSAAMSPGCMQELIGLMLTPMPQPAFDFQVHRAGV